MKHYYYKKVIALFLVLSFILPSVAMLRTQKAEAIFGVGDVVFDITNTFQNAMTAVSTAASSISAYFLQYKEGVLDPIAYFIAKAIIRQLTASIVDWINSGFEGNPSFISDPGGFFVDLADQEIGRFIEGNSDLNFLCQPFSIDIRLALALRYSPFKRKITCTLSGAFKNAKGAVDGFTGGNFAQGGWQGWISLTEEPQNNYIGAYIESRNELEVRIGNKQLTKTKEASWNNGFLSWEKCSGKDTQAAQVLRDDIKRYNDGTSQYEHELIVAKDELKKVEKSGCETQTPGKVISDGLSNTLGSPLRQLELADEFNEIINALLVQMLKQVLGPGDGLRGTSGKGAGDTSSILYRLENEKTAEETAALEKIKIEALKGIVKSIDEETRYKTNLDNTLNTFIGSKTLLESVKACYQTKLTRPTTTLTVNQISFANGRIADTDRVIAEKITPRASPLLGRIEALQSLLVTLITIETNVKTGTTVNEVVVDGTSAYEKLISEKKLHTIVEIETAGAEKDDIVKEMDKLNNETNLKMKECQLFPANGV